LASRFLISSDEGAADGSLQPGVGVGDDQTHPLEASLAETAQELGPEHFVFGIANGDIQYLPVAVGGDRRGHDDGSRDDAVIFAGFEIGGVQPQVREAGVVQPPVSERVHLHVDLPADA
jgi:hypothetical protein